MRMFFVEDSDLKIGGKREFMLSIKLNRVLADYFVNIFTGLKVSSGLFLLKF